ncbi:MAG: hypothetical protein ACJAZY_003259 [Spirosomataceae bacterium]|jgi:hypothetical protein
MARRSAMESGYFKFKILIVALAIGVQMSELFQKYSGSCCPIA